MSHIDIITKREDLRVADNVTISTYDVPAIAKQYDISTQEVERLLAAGVKFEPLTEQTIHNVTTSVGLTLLVDRLVNPDTTTTRLTHFAVGTSTAAPAASDTTLGAEVYRDQITYQGDVSTGLITILCYIPTAFPSTQPVTLGEAGLFNASSSGTLFAHVLISPTVNKTTSISMTITWNIQVS